MTILYQQATVTSTLAQNPRQLRAWNFIATDSGVANQVTIPSSSAGKTFRVEIWSDNGGSTGGTERPLNLLATSNNGISTASGSVVVTFPTPTSIVSGTKYWMSYVSQETGNWAGSNGAISAFRVTGQTLTNFGDSSPDPWSTTAAGSVAGLPAFTLESTQVSIVDIDDLVSGETFTFSVSDTGYSVTEITLDDGDITKVLAATATGTPGQYQATAPSPVDGVTLLKIGTISATATDGTTSTVSTTVDYSISSTQPDDITVVPFDYVTFTTIDSVNNVGTLFGFTPTLKTDGQVAFDSTRAIFYDDGTADFQDYTGTSIYYFRDPDDFICRTWTVETVDGVPVKPPKLMYKCTDNQSPYYSSRYVDGNRAVINSFSGVIDNGQTLTLNGHFSADRNGELFTRIATTAQVGQELVPSYVVSTGDSWYGTGASLVAETTDGNSWKAGSASPIITHESLTEFYYSLRFKIEVIDYGVGAEAPQIKFQRPLVFSGHEGTLLPILFFNEDGTTNQLQANYYGQASSSYYSEDQAVLDNIWEDWHTSIGYYKFNNSGKKDGCVFQFMKNENSKLPYFNFLNAANINCNDQRFTGDLNEFFNPVYYFESLLSPQNSTQFWLPFFKRNSTVINMWIDGLIANSSPESVWLIAGDDIDVAHSTGKAVHIPQTSRSLTEIVVTVYMGDFIPSDDIYVYVRNSNGRNSEPVLVRAGT